MSKYAYFPLNSGFYNHMNFCCFPNTEHVPNIAQYAHNPPLDKDKWPLFTTLHTTEKIVFVACNYHNRNAIAEN